MSTWRGSNLAIVVGGYVNGLGLVRSLAEQGRRVVVVCTQPHDMAHRSRHVADHRRVDSLATAPERLAELLLGHAREWSGAMVFPTNDEALASLGRHREALAPHFALFVPPEPAIPFLLEKDRMIQAAAQVGLSLPTCHGPATATVAASPGLRFPVVVKPVRAGEFVAAFGRKLLVAADRPELQDCLHRLARAKIEGQVFDLIPGPDSRIHAYCVYLDRHGDPLAECTVRKLRQSPPGFGVARVAELVPPIATLREQSLELLRHIGLRGFASVEFKHDERDGTFRFFEVNGRSVLYNTLLRQGNLDLTRLAWADCCEKGAPRCEPTLWPGVWIHLHADLLRSLQNCRREHLGLADYLQPYRRPKLFAVWSRRDPKPFLAQWSQTLRQALAGGGRRARPRRQAAREERG